MKGSASICVLKSFNFGDTDTRARIGHSRRLDSNYVHVLLIRSIIKRNCHLRFNSPTTCGAPPNTQRPNCEQLPLGLHSPSRGDKQPTPDDTSWSRLTARHTPHGRSSFPATTYYRIGFIEEPSPHANSEPLIPPPDCLPVEAGTTQKHIGGPRLERRAPGRPNTRSCQATATLARVRTAPSIPSMRQSARDIYWKRNGVADLRAAI